MHTMIIRDAVSFGLCDRYELAIQCGSLAEVLAMAAADAQSAAVDEAAPVSERPTELGATITVVSLL